jgi:predicted RNA-binding Zn-ribbon protein involved in translation (DUF1610 family)
MLEYSGNMELNAVNKTGPVCANWRAIDKRDGLISDIFCPDCGMELIRLGACFACPTCGFGSCE